MADLSSILGGSWVPPLEKRIDPPEDQLRQAIMNAGMTPPEHIVLDGKLHRFASGSKGSPGKGDKPGWYIAFADGVPAGQFGDWRTGQISNWRADVGRDITPAEQMANALRMAEAKAAREEAHKREREVAADTVSKIWESASAASPDHPYLKRKGIQAHGARITGDGRLIVPLYSQSGELASLQYISQDGGKLYHSGGQTGGMFWQVGALDEPGDLYLAEGFATAATIFEVTGRPCVVAYSASNLVPVAGALRARYGQQQSIVIVADNDASQTGQKYADQASAKYGARVVVIPIQGMDANDYAHNGHDLGLLLAPPSNDWLVHADEFSDKPSPISWIIKHWVQRDAMIMVHGPSGGGKTFVVLDWMLRIASDLNDWCGNRVSQGAVVYLAGEGHHGLRGRIAAWKTRHARRKLKMWLSKAGCDLNTAEGYRHAVEAMRALPEAPTIIVVDTLHRFLHGDENSAQDAKTMLDACAALMREFGCAVLLVHHTGVSEEAQHRARGSSAWRGALDIEVSVVPGKDGDPIQIIQRKSKDAELAQTIYANLETVEIPGWLDEDGEQVTSAVIVQSEHAPAQKKDGKQSKHAKHVQMLNLAWSDSGAEDRGGAPYISRSGLASFLESKMGLKPSSAAVYMKPSQPGKPIHDLLAAGVIEAYEHGWIVVDGAVSSQWTMNKNGN